MRDINEIKSEGHGLVFKNVIGDAEGDGDFCAYFDWFDPCDTKHHLWMKLSRGNGWEHLMVDGGRKTPTWDEMCVAKSLFWKDDEACVEFHPAKKDYVNNAEHCLHIWRPVGGSFPMPPIVMVGLQGVSPEETNRIASAVASAMGMDALMDRYGATENRKMRRKGK